MIELKQDLNPNEISFPAHDNQKNHKVSTPATKPRWTKVVRVNNKPIEELSHGKPSKGKRTATLNDDHSKLLDKRYQVSRNEEDASIKLAEADT